jgi:sialidase-1
MLRSLSSEHRRFVLAIAIGLLTMRFAADVCGQERPARDAEQPAIATERLKPISSQALFVSGTHDTHTFRIPAIVTATKGVLIAACDARRKSAADLMQQRTIDIVYRRSEDNGQTWSPLAVLARQEGGGCSDPSLLVDRITGDIFCFYNYMVHDKASKEFRFLVQKSTDHGQTWNPPVDFTDQVAKPQWKESFKFVTSGRGIQTRDGLLLHDFVRVGHGVTLFGSRDHGASWQALADIAPGDESKVVELPDGDWLVNSRYRPGQRYVHRSSDRGKTWQSAAVDLPDPRCNAGILQYTSQRDGYERDRLLFCNACANDARKNLTVRISYDCGATWSGGKVIDAGPSAYSEMTILRDGRIGVLYEAGNREIRFVRFTLSALTDGADRLSTPYAPAPATKP